MAPFGTGIRYLATPSFRARMEERSQRGANFRSAMTKLGKISQPYIKKFARAVLPGAIRKARSLGASAIKQGAKLLTESAAVAGDLAQKNRDMTAKPSIESKSGGKRKRMRRSPFKQVAGSKRISLKKGGSNRRRRRSFTALGGKKTSKKGGKKKGGKKKKGAGKRRKVTIGGKRKKKGGKRRKKGGKRKKKKVAFSIFN